jgi:site-specific DNA-methyltransferase (adenine-specific)
VKFDLRHGDSREVLRGLSEGSVDALVTDPPAGIGFMGKQWDTFGRSNPRAQDDREAAYDKIGKGASPFGYSGSGRANGDRDRFIAAIAPIFEECLRVLKPGAHGLVWALPRTSHWTATALEDAGFEIRDRVSHLFGTGFPKSLNLDGGLGTALKPACEDWWLVRKPLEGTVAANVAAHGTGALNIDATRIGVSDADREALRNAGGWARPGYLADEQVYGGGKGLKGGKPTRETADYHPSGRWPANVTLSHNDDCERVGAGRPERS